MEVRIRIKATVTDLALTEKYTATLKDGYFRSDSGERLPYERMKDECDEVIEYTVLGSYEEKNGRVKITYTEPEEIGLDCVTTLMFKNDERGVLTMTRSGELNAAFRFDTVERRQRCSYETSFMPVELTVNTKTVANKITSKGGALLIDYCIEVRGVNTERNRMLIEVRPV